MSNDATHWFDLPAGDWEHLFYPQRDYQYFRDPQPFADNANPADASPLTAAWMADAAVLAYNHSGPDPLAPEQFEKFLAQASLAVQRIRDWSGGAKGTQAYFASGAKFAVLSFRGTERDDWTDLVTDVDCFPVKEDPAGQPPGRLPRIPDPLVLPGHPAVHGGFQAALNSVWQQVNDLLQSYRAAHAASPIFFTGHSLGAALATLAIARFDGGNAALYTYGSPRTGNTAFCRQVAEHADLGIHRFVDSLDLVTTVPPRDHFFEATGGLMTIDAAGNVQPNGGSPPDMGLIAILKVLAVAVAAGVDYTGKQPPPQGLIDHSPSRYCYFLWRWAHHGRVP